MYESGLDSLKKLVGKKIEAIGMTEDFLRFRTDDGDFTYEVEGDCCSHSFFYDFVGIKKLLGNVVKSVEEIENFPDDGRRKQGNDSIQCYGYRFITEDPKFGEVSSVMSFRNDSNGYYGGSIQSSGNTDDISMISLSSYGETLDYLYV